MARLSVLPYVVVLLLLLCSCVLGGRVGLLGSATEEARQPALILLNSLHGELPQTSDVAEVLSKRLSSGSPSPNGNAATLGRSLLGTGGPWNGHDSGQNAAPFVGRSLKSGRSGSPSEGQNTAPLGASLKSGSPSTGHNSVPSTSTTAEGSNKASRSSSLPKTPSIGHKSAPTGSRTKHASRHKKLRSKFGTSFSSFAKSSQSPSPGAPSKGHNSAPLGGRKFSLVHERRTAEQNPGGSCAETHLNCELGTNQSVDKVGFANKDATSIPHVRSN